MENYQKFLIKSIDVLLHAVFFLSLPIGLCVYPPFAVFSENTHSALLQFLAVATLILSLAKLLAELLCPTLKAEGRIALLAVALLALASRVLSLRDFTRGGYVFPVLLLPAMLNTLFALHPPKKRTGTIKTVLGTVSLALTLLLSLLSLAVKGDLLLSALVLRYTLLPLQLTSVLAFRLLLAAGYLSLYSLPSVLLLPLGHLIGLFHPAFFSFFIVFFLLGIGIGLTDFLFRSLGHGKKRKE